MSARWSNTTRYVVLIAVLAALVWLLFAARPLIGPLVIAGLLAYILSPVVDWLTRHSRMKRGLAVGLVYGLCLVFLGAIPAVAAPFLVRQVRGFTDTVNWVLGHTAQFLSRPYVIAGMAFYPGDWAINADQFIAETLASLAGNALNILASLTENLVWVLVILVTTFYLLKDGARLAHWLVRLAPPSAQPEWQRLLSEIDQAWGSFLRGQLVLMLAVGVLAAAGGAAIGLPGGFVLGLLAGLLDVIPSLGPTVAGLIAVLVALFLGSSYLPLPNIWFGVVVLALYFLVQQIENIWLRPQIMSHSLRLHPGLVFVGVIGTLALQGILGALLIIPILATVGILGRYIHRKLLGMEA